MKPRNQILRFPATTEEVGADETDNGQNLFDDNAPPGSQEDPPTDDNVDPGATPQTEDIPDASENQPHSGLSRDDITAILREAGMQQQPVTTKPAAEPELSPEDYKKLFNVWEPDTETLKTFGLADNPAGVEAFTKLRDGLIRQATTMAEARIKHFVDELRESELAPMRAFVEEQRAIALHNEFYGKYDDLKDYEPLVDAVSAKLLSKGTKFKSKEDVFEQTATEARNLIKQLKGTAPGTDVSAQRTPQKQRSKMSTLTTGGQSSGGRPQAAEPKGPAGIEVFD
jgi:hypothetical protein